MDASLRLVQKLVEDFKSQEKVFLSPSYQESQARQDYYCEVNDQVIVYPVVVAEIKFHTKGNACSNESSRT